MGRGLSELQRWILVEASRRDRLYYADILHHYWQFPVRSAMRYRIGVDIDIDVDKRRNSTWIAGGTLDSPGSQRFDPDAIGRRRYNAAMASVSRACLRLEKRGLVTCLTAKSSHWAAVEITAEGREVLVKSVIPGHPT